MTSTDLESVLVSRARSGDASAYRELVERHSAPAYRLAWLITRSSEDAEEAAQDGFVKAWKALSRFREGAPFAPWLLHIVRNEAKNKVRARARRARGEGRAAAQPLTTAAAAEEDALVGARRKRVLAAVDELPERLRNVIACLYLLELSEAETATVLGVPRGTVKSRAAKARAELSGRLEDIA